MSARSAEDVAQLHGRIQAFFERSMEEEEFVIPYDQQAKVALLHERCRVLSERYDRGRRSHPCARARVHARWASPRAVETPGPAVRQIARMGYAESRRRASGGPGGSLYLFG